MNYANNTYNNSNTEYSTALNLSVNKNIIQYGSNYIVSENISSMSVSQVLRRTGSPITGSIGIILVFISMFFFLKGISSGLSIYRDDSTMYSAIGLIFLIVGIIMIVLSTQKTIFYYLVISLNSGKNVCFYCHSIDFMNDALIKITKVITEKSTETYVVNFQNCNILEGDNNLIGDNNTIGNNNTVVSK